MSIYENEDETLGSIPLDESREIRFDVSRWRGKQFASIREFLKTPRYTGYTKRGFTLNSTLIESLKNSLQNFAFEESVHKESEICRIPKSDFIDIVARSIKSEKDYVIDIREFIKSERYEGWTKKGVRIPVTYLDSSLVLLAACLEKLKEVSTPEEAPHIPSIKQLDDDQINEIIGGELPRFPEDFLDNSSELAFHEIAVPKETLKLGSFREGRQYVKTETGFLLELRNPTEARYVIYSQLRGASQVRIPNNMFAVFKAVTKYEKFVQDVQERLIEAFRKQTPNYTVAKQSARLALRRMGLPWIEKGLG